MQSIIVVFYLRDERNLNISMYENTKADLLSMKSDELEKFVVSLGHPRYRAKQIWQWMYRAKDFSEMSNLPEKNALRAFRSRGYKCSGN